jgi:23S rRNA pseudouridine1911/1915/1917 synthase
MSRSQIKARNVQAVLNGKAVKMSRSIQRDDFIELTWNTPGVCELKPENIPLDIIYENEHVVVINKLQGMVVHPGAGNWHGTVAHALLHRHSQLDAGETWRPGIVHRLDKDTSGVLIAAYDSETLDFLVRQFKERSVHKRYIALVQGIPPKMCDCIDTYISRDIKNRQRFTVSKTGKRAVTVYKVLKTWPDMSLLYIEPKTGRTHQIRVHFRHIGHPIIGDPLYGKTHTQYSLMLHAKNLAILLPGEEKQHMFSTPIPQRFLDIINCNKKYSCTLPIL